MIFCLYSTCFWDYLFPHLYLDQAEATLFFPGFSFFCLKNRSDNCFLQVLRNSQWPFKKKRAWACYSQDRSFRTCGCIPSGPMNFCLLVEILLPHLIDWSHLLLEILSPSRGSHGCRSHSPLVGASHVTSCWPTGSQHSTPIWLPSLVGLRRKVPGSLYPSPSEACRYLGLQQQET